MVAGVVLDVPRKELDALRKRFARRNRYAINVEVHEIVFANAVELWHDIRDRSPVDTGNYRDSWELIYSGLDALVITFEEYAMRLEYGFVGVDSLGRHYAQSGQPHITPSYWEARERMRKDMADLAERIVDGKL
jgi:hypothetical protein